VAVVRSVHDEHLYRPVLLVEDAPERRPEAVVAVVGRDDDGHGAAVVVARSGHGIALASGPVSRALGRDTRSPVKKPGVPDLTWQVEGLSGAGGYTAPAMSKTTSEEVDDRQLELARKAGDAYQEALEYMANEVANAGDKREVGDYIVGFAQEEAEGLYAPGDDGDLEWREPEAENCHVEVAVCDADDGRSLPEVDVEVTILDGEREVSNFRPEFLWHPGLFHYGANVELPGDGEYTVRVAVDPPEFHRHDERNGDRYAEGVEVGFEGVGLETGQS